MNEAEKHQRDLEQMSEDELVKEYSWMIRPCLLYDEEYSDCKSLSARIHQKFVSGHFTDCSQWKRDYDNCTKWKNEENSKALRELLQSEMDRRRERLRAHNANNVWKRRNAPPDDWNAPLPEWMEEKMKASFLATKAAEYKEGKLKESSFCAIS